VKIFPQLLGVHALFTQPAQAQRILPFCQTDILFVADQRTMKYARVEYLSAANA
jgi:hypothetical protein